MGRSKLGRYVLLFIGIVIVVGGWIALKATERQLKRMVSGRGPRSAPAASQPRATGPMAGLDEATSGPSGASGTAGASGASGASGAEGGTPPSESDARPSIPPGAIW